MKSQLLDHPTTSDRLLAPQEGDVGKEVSVPRSIYCLPVKKLREESDFFREEIARRESAERHDSDGAAMRYRLIFR